MDISRIRLISLLVTIGVLIGLTIVARSIPESERPGPLHTIKSRLKIERALLQVNRSEIKVLVETQPPTSNTPLKETQPDAN